MRVTGRNNPSPFTELPRLARFAYDSTMKDLRTLGQRVNPVNPPMDLVTIEIGHSPEPTSHDIGPVNVVANTTRLERDDKRGSPRYVRSHARHRRLNSVCWARDFLPHRGLYMHRLSPLLGPWRTCPEAGSRELPLTRLRRHSSHNQRRRRAARTRPSP
jgi:hypothetical protein